MAAGFQQPYLSRRFLAASYVTLMNRINLGILQVNHDKKHRVGDSVIVDERQIVADVLEKSNKRYFIFAAKRLMVGVA